MRAAAEEIVAHPRDRGDVDDRPLAIFQHEGNGVFAAKEGGLQVEVDLAVPDLLSHGDRVAGGRAADVVDEDVEAFETGDAGLHHLPHIGRRHHERR